MTLWIIVGAVGLTAAGVRFEQRTHLTADHLTLAGNDEYTEGAEFLGTARVDRNPSRVTFVVDPREDNARGLVVADHAYWLSGLRVRDASLGTGTVDVRSAGLRHRDPIVLPVQTDAGVLSGGQNQAMAYLRESRAWETAASGLRGDRLVVEVRNLRRVVIDPRRAGVSCRAVVEVTTDGPVTVELAGCGRSVRSS